MEYLPKLATIEQACKWLEAKTGKTWILARLLECHLTPYFWLDYKVGYPQLFGNRVEGYLTKMIFNGDIVRLEADGTDALVNMFTAHDGAIVKTEPGWRVPLTELRFKREDVERVAEIINQSSINQSSKEISNIPIEPTTTIHKLKTRVSILSAEIEQAKNSAIDRNDANSVWAELTKLAEKKTGVMIGFSSDGIQYRGKLYQSSQEPDVFTLSSLRKRMGVDDHPKLSHFL